MHFEQRVFVGAQAAPQGQQTGIAPMAKFCILLALFRLVKT